MSTLLYLALIANPFLTATGSIALRQMKPMNEYVVSVWLNITTGVQSMIIIMLLQQDFKPVIAGFKVMDWMLSIVTAVTVIAQQVFKF